jgi:hypothetical protein
MQYDLATPVKLPVWKDPQNFIITQSVRDEAWMYFRCWERAGEQANYIGCLHFTGVWHIDFTRFNKTRGYPNVEDTDLCSYYLLVQNSNLLASLKAQRSMNFPGWENQDYKLYHHYIVESHDFYTHIVGQAPSFYKIHGTETKPYDEIWDRV